MKCKMIRVFFAFAVCGTLAGAMAPSVAHAETCSHGHEMALFRRVYNYDYTIINQFTHNHTGHEIYWCGLCDEEQYVPFSITEDHDMCWNEDMTALVCVCGYEEKW